MIIESGAIAAVAITFAQYALRLVGNEGAANIPLAIAAIVVVTVVNYFGLKPGSRLLNVFVVLKVAALVALIVAGMFMPAPEPTVMARKFFALTATLMPRASMFAIVLFSIVALVPVLVMKS